jgi:hypothetical protein
LPKNKRDEGEDGSKEGSAAVSESFECSTSCRPKGSARVRTQRPIALAARERGLEDAAATPEAATAIF